MVIAVVILVALYVRSTHRKLVRAFPQPPEHLIVRRGGCVVAYHPEAREVGEAVLRAGGNAFDAFIAVTAAENVLAEGASSLAGPLAVLVYHARDGRLEYLDADFNTPLNRSDPPKMNDPKPGRAVLVPGAPAGLEALAAKYGRIPLSELLEPAIALARDGFPVNRLMALIISRHGDVLKRSEYGRRTFFPNGEALKLGERIRQQELADFLQRLGKEGAGYIYRGAWGAEFLSAVRAHGGALTVQDLEQYQANWERPWTAVYRGHNLGASSGRSYGGLWVLLALKTLERANLQATGRYYWQDADMLELMIRITRQVWSEPQLFAYRFLDDPESVQSLLTNDYAAQIWERVSAKAPLNFMGVAGSHSYHITVSDSEGNVVSGTTTIESDPWGAGIFVQGVPLTTGGAIPWSTEPGQRRLSLFSILLAFKDDQPKFSVGTISSSVVEAAFQLLVKLIDYDMSVKDAVITPRFGTFPGRIGGGRIQLKLNRNWLDPRIDTKIVKMLKRRGVKFQRWGLVDTGLGVVARFEPEAVVEGLPLPVPYLSNPFSVSAW